MQHQIQKLLNRRKVHDNRINDLLNNVAACQHQRYSQKSISSINGHQPIQTFRTNLSKCSNLSLQVNLLANLSFQNESAQFLEQKSVNQESLRKSFYLHFHEDIDISLKSDENLKSGILLSETSVDFQIIAQYFDENQFWEDVFIQDNGEYYALVYDNKYENQYILLSDRQLFEEEIALVSQNQNKLYIGYLLLYRTLSKLKTGSAPSVLRKIFGFPYKCYNILLTKKYLQFMNYTQNSNPLQALQLIIGKRKSDNCYETIRQNLDRYDYNKIVQKYDEVVLIKAQQMNSRVMKIAHKRNHHIVADLYTAQKGKYYISLNNQHKNKNTIYRLCILDQNLQIVHYELLNNNEFCEVALNRAQYKIYLSQISKQPVSKFDLVIQTKQQISDLQLNLKFVQEYNQFTRILINKYIQSIDLSPVQKQIERLTQVDYTSPVIVIRVKLNFLGFFIDFLSFNPEKIFVAQKIKIQYEQQEVLCDLEYRSNCKKIQVGSSWVFQVYLSKCSTISSISSLSYTLSTLAL